ncbi:hypothetical protein RBH26_01850 [Natronolimnohabitans sp. A-GB9]|uniref:hypothetical protein n=1 Tax=Natronolimnohabitans sp. A-GB9 TaxID=3069757 RepID=UPI0027B6110D|nr:hypothetical protein [Natronolimnohabitans sp. A-GB9]MDQ2049218.1 hypothetical protein [Natronolimnohabitans sp. A-GB9]
MSIVRALLSWGVAAFLLVVVASLAGLTVVAVSTGSFDVSLLLAWVFVLLAVKIWYQSRTSEPDGEPTVG